MDKARLEELRDFVSSVIGRFVPPDDFIVSEEGKDLIELIDAELARQTIADAEVQRAINDIKHRMTNGPDGMPISRPLGWYVKDGRLIDYSQLAIRALQQMRTEPCEWCELETSERIFAYGMHFKKMPVRYCPNCGRRLAPLPEPPKEDE